MKTQDAVSVYCPFASPGDPIAVRMRTETLTALQHSAFRETAAGGASAGFLIGSSEPATHGGVLHSILMIDSFVPLAAQCRRGGSFDYLALQKQLARVESKARALGFYRINVGGQAGPGDDDVRLMAEYFSPESVLLLLEGSRKHRSATFYHLGAEDGSGWRASYPLSLGGTPPALRPHNPVGTDPAPLRHGEWQDIAHSSALRLTEMAALLPKLTTTQVAVLTGAAVILGVAGIQYRTLNLLTQQRQVAPAISNTLDLTTARSGANQWRISWNRSAPAIRKGAKGHLSIRDGYLRKELDLAPADLQSGTIEYLPVADDVSFRLEVFDMEAGRGMSESIRVLANPWPAAGSPPVYAQLPTGDEAQRDSQLAMATPSRPSAHRVERSTPAASPAEREAAASPAPQQKTAESPRVFSPPAPVEPVIVGRTVNDLPAAPVVEARTSPSAFVPPGVGEPFKLPAPPKTAAAEPEPSTAGPPRPTSNIAPKEQEAIQPPVLIRRVDPQYPKAAMDMRLAGEVKIQATIGTDGRVHDPHAISGPFILRAAALQALSYWVYKPATLNGKTVPAQSTIEVRFGHN